MKADVKEKWELGLVIATVCYLHTLADYVRQVHLSSSNNHIAYVQPTHNLHDISHSKR